MTTIFHQIYQFGYPYTCDHSIPYGTTENIIPLKWAILSTLEFIACMSIFFLSTHILLKTALHYKGHLLFFFKCSLIILCLLHIPCSWFPYVQASPKPLCIIFISRLIYPNQFFYENILFETSKS